MMDTRQIFLWPPQEVTTDAMTQEDSQTHSDGKEGPLHEAET